MFFQDISTLEKYVIVMGLGSICKTVVLFFRVCFFCRNVVCLIFL